MTQKIKQKSSLGAPVFSNSNKLYRVIWMAFYYVFFRYSPVFLFRFRVLLLKMFGAKIAWTSRVYSSSKIWAPYNLQLGEFSCIGPRVDVYNQGFISIGNYAIVSQGVTLCASSHDYLEPEHQLILGKISIGNNAWVCAEAFVGFNLTIGDGAVIGARAVQVKDAQEWMVYGGNPAKKIKARDMKETGKSYV